MITTRPEKFGTLHFIGIGGIGMSGIAEALHALGYTVQGSDASAGYNTERLERRGIKVFVGHDAAHVIDATAVVVSSAIKPNNPELVAARARKIPVIRRADMLAELMRHKRTISIAGTHGKTTTTSLVGAMLDTANLDPTIINGGIIHAYGTNTRMGQGEWMVVESDESDGSFLRLPTTIAVVTNIDPEHMEHYGSFDAVRAAYKTFIENIPFYGLGVLCTDHPVVAELAAEITDRRLVTYGLNDGADIQAINVQANPYGATFDVLISSRLTGGTTQTLPGFGLPMMGLHNVQNALVPIAIGFTQGIDIAAIRTSLREFQGVKRRFTKTGVVNGITIIDDYGHHPVEIMATLKAARQAANGGHVIAVVQPHRYSRLSSLFPEFCTAFTDADRVIVADVYAAGEEPIAGFNRDSLVSGLLTKGKQNVTALGDPADLPQIIAAQAKPGDLVICLGAGTITTWAHDLPGQLEEILDAQSTSATSEMKIG